MTQFAIDKLSFTYAGASKPALDQVSLEVQAGDYLTICGRSGCGKTTLLRHMKSVLAPAGQVSGQVLLEGVPLDQVPQRDQSSRIGFVMQDPDAQIVTDKVWHELAYGLESLGCDQRTMRLRVAEMASYFGIQTWFHKSVRDLSGGQKQLLNLASIMAMQPEVLILDEPTSQLDPIAASDFLNTIRKINLELGTTVILTEHRLEEVFSAADRVVVMDQGHIVLDAPPRQVGTALREQDADMVAALPAPMRIFFAVNQGSGTDANSADATTAGNASSDAESAGGVPDLTHSCPLTVREGRTWLDSLCQERGIPDRELDLEEEPDLDMSPKKCALGLQELWFRYDRESADVLRGVDLRVPEGCLFAIVGGNGTGKSTTLKAAAGLIKPYRGKVTLLGKALKDWGQKELFNGGIALLPQNPRNLFVKKTVALDLADMLTGRGLDKDEQRNRVEEAVENLQIGHLLQAHPFDLSGGEQQRVALAKVLLTKPRLVLLDEPTKGIDNAFKKHLAAIFADMTAQGTTVIMASHDVEFCAQYADLVAMFFDGAVVTVNPPRRFFASNNFYTTAANRMSRRRFRNAVTDEDVVRACGAE